MIRFAIIGAGAMGQALAIRLSRGGLDGVISDLHPERAEHAAAAAAGPGSIAAGTIDEALAADVVILATWYPDTIAFAAEHEGRLSGKVVVDVANPLDDTYTQLTVPASDSAAEHLSRRLPNAVVVKAFNTVTATTLSAGGIEAMTLDTFVAADDPAAKAVVLELATRAGLRALDAGRLQNARLLERLAAFGIELGQRYGFGFGAGIKFLPDTPYLVKAPELPRDAAVA